MNQKPGEADDEPGEPIRPTLHPAVQWERYGRYPYLLAKLVFWVAIVAGLLWFLTTISAVAFPIFVSILIAYILSPAVTKLEGWGISRSLGIVVLIMAVGGFFTVFGWFLYPTMADQVERVGERADDVVEVLEDQTLPWISETFGAEVPETWAEVAEEYGEELQEAISYISESVGEWAVQAVDRTRAVVVTIFNLILIPIFTFYFLRDFEHAKKRLEQFIPVSKQEAIFGRLRSMDQAVSQWFRGQLEVSLILAVLYGIGLGLVYGLTGHDVQSGVMLGLLTGFLNVIPYLGFAIGSVLAFLVVIIDWTGWAALLGVAAAFAIIQTAESYYITPKVMGEKLGLRTITVIIVLVIGGHIAGIMGVLLAIPITAAFKVLLPDIIAWYQKSSVYTGVPVAPATSDYLVMSRRDVKELVASQSAKGQAGADGSIVEEMEEMEEMIDEGDGSQVSDAGGEDVAESKEQSEDEDTEQESSTEEEGSQQEGGGADDDTDEDKSGGEPQEETSSDDGLADKRRERGEEEPKEEGEE